MFRSKRQQAAVAEGKRVETANSLHPSDFFNNYLNNYEPNIKQCQIIKGNPETLSRHILENCLALVDETSSDDYRNSEIKWSLSKKRKEMLLPDMKYIILVQENTEQKLETEKNVIGFISFMVTYEDGYEVVYIYEIHFYPAWRGKGIGKSLMRCVEYIAHEVGVEKIMLTVFISNNQAVKWYLNLGYNKDEFSPSPKRLRNGTVKEPAYVILSKVLGES